MNRRHTIIGTLALATALLLAGCGSSSDGDSSSKSKSDSGSSATAPSDGASTQSPQAVVTIKDFKFKVPSTVKPGAMVMVKNEDSEAHTVTADDKGGFDVKIDPGKTAMFTAPSQAGSFPFHCTYHSDMHGTLKVG